MRMLRRLAHRQHRRDAGAAAFEVRGPLVARARTDARRDRRGEIVPHLLIGDAAVAFDPLSGWGVGKALADSAGAAAAVDAWLRGDPSKLLSHTAGIRESYQLHLAQRRAYYAMERRWPDAPFWARMRDRMPTS